MAEKDIGTLKDYITLDDAAMTLARMRMRRTVRNASKEFLLRFFDAGAASENKCRARDYLPPRRQWARPGPGVRGKKNTGQLQVASIMRCIRAHEKSGALETTEWGGRLVRLVADVQRRVGECDIAIRPPRAGKVPKQTVSGRRETRDISIFDDPSDAVLLVRTAAYLRDWFEPVLKAGRCCYSFRKSRKLSHQSAVGALCRWRKRHEGEELFVAECDIRKFFDNIRHDEILKALDRYAERDRLQAMFAGAVVLAASYSQKDVGKDSGSRFAMGKAAEYGVPRYVMYNPKRDGADPMFNLSREEILKGAKILDCESDCKIDLVKFCGSQLEFVM